MTPYIEVPRPSTTDRSRSPSPAPPGTLFFGYGSNLWHTQVEQRFPSAKFVGIARLRHWRWQINEKRMANMVEMPAAPYSPRTAKWLGPLFSSEDLREDNERVYGMVWQLDDEAERLMHRAARPGQVRQTAGVELWVRKETDKGKKLNLLKGAKRTNVVFYVDREHTTDAEQACTGGYAYKIQQGVADALAEGVPQGYVDKCIKPFLTLGEDKMMEHAVREAIKHGVDVKTLVAKAEEELARNEEEDDDATHDKAFEQMLKDAGMQASELPSRKRAVTSTW
jgi:gamma-glutamylcyclotransferase